MMLNTGADFLKGQAIKALKAHFQVDNLTELLFQIELDPEDTKELKTNFDEIMNFWVLPKKIGYSISLDDVCNTLTTAKNEIPLWIKITEIEKGRLYRLTSSKRFRKRKVVEEWHKDNSLTPFKTS